MVSRRTFLQSVGIAAVATPYIGVSSRAQDLWPAREIHAICGTPPGSGADTIVRFYARKLQELCGKTVIVENKPGAFGNIATEYVARTATPCSLRQQARISVRRHRSSRNLRSIR